MEPAEGSVGGQSGQDCLVVLKGHSSEVWEAAWCPSPDGSSEKFVATYVLHHLQSTCPNSFLGVQLTSLLVYGRRYRASVSRLSTITELHQGRRRRQFQQ